MNYTRMLLVQLLSATFVLCLLSGCGESGEELFRKAKMAAIDQEDEVRATELYRKSADKGYPEAMVVVGMSYLEGKNVEQDYNCAFSWFHKAAEAEYPDGMFFLGDCYQKGLGTERDLEKAEYWKEKAFKAGNARAMLEYAETTLRQVVSAALERGNFEEGQLGYSVKECRDMQKVVRTLAKLARDGKFAGQVDVGGIEGTLGYIYAHGIGIARNAGKAIGHLKKAVDLCDKPSIRRLGVIYCDGILVSKQYELGIPLLREVLKENPADVRMLELMGNAYLDGSWKGKDAKQAKTCFEEALKIRMESKTADDASIGDALCGLGRVMLFENEEFRDEKQGIQYLERAEKAGFPEARYYLALAYCGGIGVPYDEEKALRLLDVPPDPRDGGDLAEKVRDFESRLESKRVAHMAISSLEAKTKALKAQIEAGEYLPCGGEDISTWKEAAEDGNAEAQWRLGVCLADGRGVSKNDTEAEKWLRESARQGYGRARATLKRNRWWWSADDDKWLALHEAAANGDVAGQRNLGKRYLLGSYPAQNWRDAEGWLARKPEGYVARQAVRWLQSAAKGGDAEGLYWLAFCTAKGVGVKKNEPVARRMLASAKKRGLSKTGDEANLGPITEAELREKSRQGNPAAQFVLGKMLAERGDKEGIKLLRHLAGTAKGLPAALWLENHYAGRDHQQAAYWCHRAVDLGNRDAMFRMVDYEPDRALSWWKKIHEKYGDDASACAVALCYEEGRGCPRNLDKAKQWYQKGRSSYDVERIEEMSRQLRTFSR